MSHNLVFCNVPMICKSGGSLISGNLYLLSSCFRCEANLIILVMTHEETFSANYVSYCICRYVEGGMGSVSLSINHAAKEAGACIATSAEVSYKTDQCLQLAVLCLTYFSV